VRCCQQEIGASLAGENQSRTAVFPSVRQDSLSGIRTITYGSDCCISSNGSGHLSSRHGHY
jgi:hypothetical protein